MAEESISHSAFLPERETPWSSYRSPLDRPPSRETCGAECLGSTRPTGTVALQLMRCMWGDQLFDSPCYSKADLIAACPVRSKPGKARPMHEMRGFSSSKLELTAPLKRELRQTRPKQILLDFEVSIDEI
jgi:hypothetical protein